MPSSPLSATEETPHYDSQAGSDSETSQDDYDDYYPEVPSSSANLQSAKKPKVPKKTRAFNRRMKAKKRKDEESGSNICHFLDLPGDVLHLLLVRLPPRSLLQLGATCKLLHNELKNETFWRQCYINRFLWDGAATNDVAREEVKVLVQGCVGTGGRGWKREALSREGMLERWVASRTSTVVHIPVNVLVRSLSLAYPPPASTKNTVLVVGKMTTGGGSGSASPASTTPTKMSHRQKYENMLAVSTRTPPTLFSVGLDNSALVKSDPLTGKVTKGFWGPGQDANFHLRPHWDPSSAPAAVFIPKRSQTHMLWGLLTGSVVHTTMQTRSHATHGGRANSINVYSKAADNHLGAVMSIHQPESSGGDPFKWVTGGEDGRVKYWQLNPGPTRSGKKTPTDAQPASMTCLFTSGIVDDPHVNRSEEVRLRQMAVPDAIIAVACDIQFDVVCGATEDGDLRVWLDAAGDPREVRIDAGSKEDYGGVKDLHMLCTEGPSGLIVSVLVHHNKHPNLTRYDISFNSGKEPSINTIFYGTPGDAPLTTLHVNLVPTAPISAPKQAEPTLSARIVTPASGSGSGSGANTPVQEDLPIDDLPRRLQEDTYGRFIVAGDQNGQAYIWAWDGRSTRDMIMPIRDWTAADGKITAIDFFCGLVTLGSYDGHYAVFDPLPVQPERLRAFRPPGHLTPGDVLLAASDEPRAKYYNVNHLLVDNDLVIAAIGRSVQTWRSGTGKGRQSGKDSAGRKGGSGGTGGGKGEFRGHSRTLDLRDLHHDAVESHYEIQEENEARVHASQEQQHRAAMEDLGLEDGDAALEYALMLSQQEADAASAAPSPVQHEDDDEEAEAIRAVEAFKLAEERAKQQADEEDLAEMLEMIRLAEERERDQ